MNKQIFLLLTFGVLSFAQAEPPFPEESTTNEPNPQPWFTGTLLVPEDVVVPLGHYCIEPFIFAFKTYGLYDSHWHNHSIPSLYTFNPLAFIAFGILPWMDLQMLPSFSYKNTEGVSATRFNDLPINFNFQLYPGDPDRPWIPTVKLSIGEIFPTGQYRNLNPKRLGTDIGGEGAFSTNVGLVFASLFHLGGHVFLKTILAPTYFYLAPTKVTGFNFYGGGFGTRGKVFPNSNYNTILSIQLSLTQRWVFAMDISTEFADKARFKGKRGVTASKEPATVGFPSSSQISLSPAIEYNWNANLGIIAGSWFTIAGRNSEAFASAAVAFSTYY